jgi:hypothetical protein
VTGVDQFTTDVATISTDFSAAASDVSSLSCAQATADLSAAQAASVPAQTVWLSISTAGNAIFAG